MAVVLLVLLTVTTLAACRFSTTGDPDEAKEAEVAVGVKYKASRNGTTVVEIGGKLVDVDG